MGNGRHIHAVYFERAECCVVILSHRRYWAGDKDCMESVENPQVLGTIQYIDWLILNERTAFIYRRCVITSGRQLTLYSIRVLLPADAMQCRQLTNSRYALNKTYGGLLQLGWCSMLTQRRPHAGAGGGEHGGGGS